MNTQKQIIAMAVMALSMGNVFSVDFADGVAPVAFALSDKMTQEAAKAAAQAAAKLAQDAVVAAAAKAAADKLAQETLAQAVQEAVVVPSSWSFSGAASSAGNGIWSLVKGAGNGIVYAGKGVGNGIGYLGKGAYNGACYAGNGVKSAWNGLTLENGKAFGAYGIEKVQAGLGFCKEHPKTAAAVGLGVAVVGYGLYRLYKYRNVSESCSKATYCAKGKDCSNYGKDEGRTCEAPIKRGYFYGYTIKPWFCTNCKSK